MENRVTKYKEYVINTEQGEEKGIFFRNPLQKVFFDAYYGDSNLSAWKYLDDIRNPIRRLYEILIGNRNIIKNIKNWSDDVNWAGFDGYILCLPIYFKRKYRKLTAIAESHYDYISKIESYGYESEFNSCIGNCHIEKTIVRFHDGEFIRIKRKKQYHFTYEHIIKEIIDSGIIDGIISTR